MKAVTLFTVTLMLFFTSTFSAGNSCLDRWEEFSRSGAKHELTHWLRTEARNILYKENKRRGLNLKLPANPECTGLFITLIKDGKVRGCFGAFSHGYGSPSDILGYYIKGALFLDPRHVPLERDELDDTEIVLTVTGNPQPVDDLNNVDISNFGVFIECEDSSKKVIVPAEYRTTSRIAGLTKNSRCRYSKFRAVTIRDNHSGRDNK